MLKNNNKGYFLAETIIVLTVVALAITTLYVNSMESYVKEKNELTLKITQYPCTIQEYQDNFPDTEDENVLDAYTAQQKIETLTIPLQKEVEKNTFVNADGGTAVFSSLGLKIDMKKGLGLSEAESNDPYSLYYIALNYKNGSTYVVADSARDGIHNCPEEIDNSSYCCEDLDGNMIFVFNRLVDSSQVKSITVNESIYSANYSGFFV